MPPSLLRARRSAPGLGASGLGAVLGCLAVPALAQQAPAPPAAAPPTPVEAPAPVTAPQRPAGDAPVPEIPLGDPMAPADPAPGGNRPPAALANPNTVLPAPPLPAVPEVRPPNGPPATVVAPVTPPAGPVAAAPPGVPPTEAPPVPAPGETPPPPGQQIMEGTEQSGGSFALESPNGIVYDMERGLALARGKVRFAYREFQVSGDRGLVDYNTNRATLTGNLTVTVKGQVFRGESLVFDLDSGRWVLSSLGTEFPPDFFPPGTVLEPIYVRDGTVRGQDEKVSGENFKFSSCDRDHYYLLSKRLEFYRTPEGEPERIVLRKNWLHVMGRRILPVPVYVISLLGQRSRRSPLQATFGQNDYDGFFVKSLYDIRADAKLTDSVLLDAFQKRGFGVGFQREYATGAGLIYLYALSSRQNGREVNARIDRTYRLADGYRTNLKYAATQNNSLTGAGISSRNGQATLFREGARAQSTFTASFNESNFGLGSSGNGSLQLEHRQDFGSGFRLEASSLLSESKSSFGGQSATSDQSATLSRTGSLFDLYLRAEQHDDLQNKTSYQLERLPELTLQSTTDRLDIPGLTDHVPGDFTLGLGKFNEPASGQRKERADFFYTAREKRYRLAGNGSSTTLLRTSGNFEQAFYSDDTARYNYAYIAGLENKVGPFSAFLNYSKQRTYGFTPFQFDFSTPGEYLDATLSYQAGEVLRFNLSGGRDIENSFTRDVIARAQWAPSPDFYTSLGTSFAPESNNFGDIYGNFRYRRDRNRFGGGQYALGLRYSPNGRGLTRANASVDLQLGSKTRLQGFAGYDGFSKKFDFTQIRVTRDLHCYTLFATYDGQRKELRLDLAIKAFPFADTRFGRNNFSEGFDAFVGDAQ